MCYFVICESHKSCQITDSCTNSHASLHLVCLRCFDSAIDQMYSISSIKYLYEFNKSAESVNVDPDQSLVQYALILYDDNIS